MNEYIIILTSHSKNDPWNSGDPVITEGIFRLLPELGDFDIVYSKDVAPADVKTCVAGCRYIIQAGTPSWMTLHIRSFWKAAMECNKHMAMLGIGLAVNYYQTFWYGAEDFMALKQSGIVDLIVCRDRNCYYWLHNKMGFDGAFMDVLPCPAYYCLDAKPCVDKKKVVLSIPNEEETAHETDSAFYEWRAVFRDLIAGWSGGGVEVSLMYQRHRSKFQSFLDNESYFFGKPIKTFDSFEEFKEFTESMDVYVGFRNHGALPMAGAGKAVLLLGTDLRQTLADETPFVSKIDVSFVPTKASLIADWFGSLNPSGIGHSSLNYRECTVKRWRVRLEPVIKALSGGL